MTIPQATQLFDTTDNVLNFGIQSVSTLSLVEEPAREQTIIRPLISNEDKKILEIAFQIVIFIVTSCLGLVANIVNTAVYWKMGLRDSITLGFFAMSVSDLFTVSLPLMISGVYIAKFMYPNSPINFIGIHYVTSAWLRQMSYSFSCILTAFLSIERCCCVILPLKVKMIFTRNRTLTFIIILFFFHVASFAPIFATHQLRWMKDPRRNNTKTLRVWFGPNREDVEDFNYTLMSIVTPTISQIILMCSAVIMVRGLIQASKFKRAATGHSRTKAKTSTSTKSKELTTAPNEGSTKAVLPSTEDDSKQNGIAMLSQRDARLVKAMVFLNAILSVCNIPYLSLVYAMLIEPELDIGKAYHNTYSVVFSVSIAMATINASANILVYINTSSRYREILGQMCSATVCKKVEK